MSVRECVCVRARATQCVVSIPPPSRSLSICVLSAQAAFEWARGRVYVAEFAGVQSKRCV